MHTVNYLDYDPTGHQTRLHGQRPQAIGMKPMGVLETWANAYGCGLEGSRQAIKHTCGGRQKLPVLVDPFRQIYFFPTQSPTRSDCVWINASQIRRVVGEGLSTKILFVDGHAVCLPMGPRSIRHQLKRIERMRQTILQHVMSDGLWIARHP